ncbi:hypothetical protein ACFOLF_22150 [Paenibacillus sepulcri]|uniref:P68 RBP/TagC-like beta-propeller domain-containing protein n=1 Tax=Paenibacillus sepulcri TaxID=359917 RepID=A0ABS7C8R0_9BACL|nr:hypothetical protein [Paenibacillus sepulcri]
MMKIRVAKWAGALLFILLAAITFESYTQAAVPVSQRFDLTDPSTQLIRSKALHNNTVLQSFAFDNTNKKIFTVQLMAGGQQLPGESAPVSGANRALNGDLCVTKLDLSGNVEGYMFLKGFGHGVQIGAEPVGSASYLWTEVDALSDGTSGWGSKLARFQFVNGQVLTSASSSLTKFELVPGADRTTVNIDMTHGYLTMRYREDGSFRYGVYSLAQVKAGNYTAFADIAQPSGLGTFQGFTSFGSTLYLLEGNSYNSTTSIYPNGNTYITSVNLNNGIVSDKQLTKAGYTLTFREPEGMAVQIPDTNHPENARLGIGLASTVSESNTSKLASIYYKDSLTD